MLKRTKDTPLTEEYLDSLIGMKPVEPSAFFYERLIKRMDAERKNETSILLWRPLTLAASLAILLAINLIFYFQQAKTASKSSESIRDFAAAYDQNLNQQF